MKYIESITKKRVIYVFIVVFGLTALNIIENYVLIIDDFSMRQAGRFAGANADMYQISDSSILSSETVSVGDILEAFPEIEIFSIDQLQGISVIHYATGDTRIRYSRYLSEGRFFKISDYTSDKNVMVISQNLMQEGALFGAPFELHDGNYSYCFRGTVYDVAGIISLPNLILINMDFDDSPLMYGPVLYVDKYNFEIKDEALEGFLSSLGIERMERSVLSAQIDHDYMQVLSVIIKFAKVFWTMLAALFLCRRCSDEWMIMILCGASAARKRAEFYIIAALLLCMEVFVSVVLYMTIFEYEANPHLLLKFNVEGLVFLIFTGMSMLRRYNDMKFINLFLKR